MMLSNDCAGSVPLTLGATPLRMHGPPVACGKFGLPSVRQSKPPKIVTLSLYAAIGSVSGRTSQSGPAVGG